MQWSDKLWTIWLWSRKEKQHLIICKLLQVLAFFGSHHFEVGLPLHHGPLAYCNLLLQLSKRPSPFQYSGNKSQIQKRVTEWWAVKKHIPLKWSTKGHAGGLTFSSKWAEQWPCVYYQAAVWTPSALWSFFPPHQFSSVKAPSSPQWHCQARK